ncbi:50S ribosomal protein L25/general stress protein Ctc [Propylenella binzhouense]|uniref:Large ribosomal subunit protein bL25 n=1 Tax=Propylenella binzhouense TaxID=2555902 RepID=A0A964T1X0_9HYPH|nr:50S ribosomal protein L25/general stress protein Ctc [Propylenella binzhouense]MYZ46750.1 50S ribosomal protein L25/general stress protein Ctc [Propylenella binzhouense]
MSQTYELKAEVRDRVGKGAARAVRREGKIPAVIYGDKKPPIPIALPLKEVTMKIHGGGFLTTIATLDIGSEKIRVIAKDYSLDPVKDFPVHVDFLRVAEGATLEIEIPVHFVNEEKSRGIKRGGVLNVVRHAIELIVPADAIPDAIEIDLEGRDIGDSIHISHVKLPEGVRPTITDRDFTIATIAAPAVLTAAEEGTEEAAPSTEAGEGQS